MQILKQIKRFRTEFGWNFVQSLLDKNFIRVIKARSHTISNVTWKHIFTWEHISTVIKNEVQVENIDSLVSQISIP